MKNRDYLTEQTPWKALLYFAIPLFIGNLFQQMYTMVDTMVLGRFVGEEAMAAAGASFSFTNVFIWIAVGGGIGASVIVSRYFGAHAYRKMKTAIYSAMLSFLAVSMILTVLGILLGKQVMILMRTPEDVLSPAMTYLNIYFFGLPFLFMYNVISSMFNALGKSRYPLCFLIFSSVLNIILDIYMVVSLHLGIAGVAIATMIAQGLSAVLSLFVLLHLLKSLYEKEAAANCQLFDMKEVKSMAKIALPSIIQQSTVSIGLMAVQSVVNGFGAAALAGYTAGMRVESFGCVPWTAFNTAVSTYTAQNIGAKRTGRVHEGYMAINRMIFIFAIIYFVLLELFADQIITVFLGSNLSEAAFSVGSRYIRCLGFSISLLGFKMAVDGVLRGAADTFVFTIANFVNLGLRIMISFLFAPILGIQMVWLASPVGWGTNWLISYLHYRKTDYAKNQTVSL